MSIFDELAIHRVVPVVVVDDAEHADVIGHALATGGLPVAEVTLRTSGAYGAIERLVARGDILVGAGTVTEERQVDRAVNAGARFIVSPGLDERVVGRAHQHGVPALPGIASPTELQAALRLGLDAVKVFPAKVLGGPAFIEALAAPFPGIRFMPSGGVSMTNAPEYLALPSVFAVGGSWMVDRELIRTGDVAGLRALVESTVAQVGKR